MATNKETSEFDLGDAGWESADEEIQNIGWWIDEATQQRHEKWDYKERLQSKCEEHRTLQSKYKDLLTRFEGLSAKVRVFVAETEADLTVKT